MRRFTDLSEQEILALAITNEEEDARIYRDIAHNLSDEFAASGKMFEAMAEEEVGHRTALFSLYREKFGEHIPLIRRQDVSGFIRRSPVWLVKPLNMERIREYIATSEYETARFYRTAAERSKDTSIKELLYKLAETEDTHERRADELSKKYLTQSARDEETETSRRMFVLQYVQPGLVGLMDGSVSTLAPLFAAAFATHNTFSTFLVGLAAAIGAGISMGFAEALSDDGQLSGRGAPVLRGIVCGSMTALGGLGHTLPYLIPSFYVATGIAIGVVVIELLIISYIRYKFMDTRLLSAAFQVMVGGALVFLAGIIIGSA